MWRSLQRCFLSFCPAFLLHLQAFQIATPTPKKGRLPHGGLWRQGCLRPRYKWRYCKFPVAVHIFALSVFVRLKSPTKKAHVLVETLKGWLHSLLLRSDDLTLVTGGIVVLAAAAGKLSQILIFAGPSTANPKVGSALTESEIIFVFISRTASELATCQDPDISVHVYILTIPLDLP